MHDITVVTFLGKKKKGKKRILNTSPIKCIFPSQKILQNLQYQIFIIIEEAVLNN